MNAQVRNLAVVALFAMASSSTSFAQTLSPPSSAPPPVASPSTGSPPPPGHPMALPEEQRPGYHKHDGFYLRLTFGAGYFRTRFKYQTTPEQMASLTLSGVGPVLNLALGGVVAPNLILLFQFTRSSASDLKMDRVGDVDRLANNREIRFFNFGPGVAYYFDSLGLYLSGAVMLAWMNQSDDGTGKVSEPDQITDKGFGTSLMIGKEWWVSRNWGVGMASMFQLASMKSRKVDARWLTTSLSFLLSVTFN